MYTYWDLLQTICSIDIYHLQFIYLSFIPFNMFFCPCRTPIDGDLSGTARHESFTVPHDRPGLLGMCCHGKDRGNGAVAGFDAWPVVKYDDGNMATTSNNGNNWCYHDMSPLHIICYHDMAMNVMRSKSSRTAWEHGRSWAPNRSILNPFCSIFLYFPCAWVSLGFVCISDAEASDL